MTSSRMGANKQFVLTCYRAALREARRIDCQLAGREALAVRAPLVVDPHAPAHSWSKPDHEYRLDTLRALLPGILKAGSMLSVQSGLPLPFCLVP